MPGESFDESQSWRERAKRTRASAKNNHTIADIIADTYEHVAQQIELRSNSEKSN